MIETGEQKLEESERHETRKQKKTGTHFDELFVGNAKPKKCCIFVNIRSMEERKSAIS